MDWQFSMFLTYFWYKKVFPRHTLAFTNDIWLCVRVYIYWLYDQVSRRWAVICSGEEAWKPIESVWVACSCLHTAHEYFNVSSSTWVVIIRVFSLCNMELKAHDLTKFFFFQCFFPVDFISKDHDWLSSYFGHAHYSIKFFPCLRQPILISSINHKDDPINSTGVVFPCSPGCLMTSEIVGVEFNISNCNLSLVRMVGWVCLCELITLQHVQHCCLASVIQP